MARTLIALLEPAVLRWARESIGLTPLAAALKIGLSDETLVEQWEAGSAAPSIPQLREAARVYKRPLAVFFLSRPPEGSFDVMHDFRRLPDAEARLWSPELHGEYRRARDQRDVALEIANLAQEPIPQTCRLPEPLSEDDEELASLARRNLIEVAPVRFPAGGDEFAHLALCLRWWRLRGDSDGVLTSQPGGGGSFLSWPSSPPSGRLRRPGAALLTAGRPAGPVAMADDGNPGLRSILRSAWWRAISAPCSPAPASC